MSFIYKIKIGNELFDIQDRKARQLIDKLNNDYTAWEVSPNNSDLEVGTYSRIFDTQTFSNATLIRSNMTEIFVIRTFCPNYQDSDVTVDWGDGTTQSIADGEYTLRDTNYDVSEGEQNYTMEHTYTTPGNYIVKVYGKKYFSITHQYKEAVQGGGYHYGVSNLMSRVFDHDLPIASHVGNLATFCLNAYRLLYVNVNNIKYRHIVNASGMFSECYNLVKAIGFKRMFTTACMETTFKLCTNLTYCDAQLPSKSVYASADSMFFGCTSLAMDVNKFIPETGIHEDMDVERCFEECSALTGTFTDYSKKQLWNNKWVTWKGNHSCFKNCSANIISQVPISWGGTASDDIIQQTSVNGTTLELV